MTKKEAISLFGSTASDLARAVGVSPQYISKLPEELPQRMSDRVLGVAYRLGKLPDKPTKAA